MSEPGSEPGRIGIGLVTLADGGHAVVDAADADWLNCFRWRRIRTGRDRREYVAMFAGRDFTLMHRLLADPPAGVEVDHVNGCGLDNRHSNLRTATRSEQCGNRRWTGNATGFKGVAYRPGRGCYEASIGSHSHREGAGRRYLGAFKTAEEAAIAYDLAALERWGAHASTNLLKP